MMTALLLLFGLTGLWLIGLGFVAALMKCLPDHNDQPTPPAAELLGLGLLFGIALTSWFQMLWCLAGGQLSRTLSVGFSLVGIVLGLPVFLRLRNRTTLTTEPHTLAKLCRNVVLVLSTLLMAQTLLSPQRLWDERAIFGIKAAIFHEEHTITAPVLQHPDFVQYHPQYPLLIPLAEQHVYALIGKVDDRWSKAIIPLMYLGLLLTFAGVLTRHFGANAAWLFTFLLATVPALMPWEYGFLSAQADAPLGCFHAISVLYLWDWLKREPNSRPSRPLILAGLAAGCAIFTKDEGIAFLLVDLTALFLLTLCSSNPLKQNLLRAMLATIVFVTVAICLIAPWFVHRSTLPSTTEMRYFSRMNLETITEGLPTLTWSVPHLLHRMFLEALSYGLHWWGLLLGILLFPKRTWERSQLLLLLDICGAIGGLLFAGMLAPTPVEEHLGGSSDRFLVQLAPVAVLFIAGQGGALRSSVQ